MVAITTAAQLGEVQHLYQRQANTVSLRMMLVHAVKTQNMSEHKQSGVGPSSRLMSHGMAQTEYALHRNATRRRFFTNVESFLLMSTLRLQPYAASRSAAQVWNTALDCVHQVTEAARTPHPAILRLLDLPQLSLMRVYAKTNAAPLVQTNAWHSHFATAAIVGALAPYTRHQ